MAQIDAVVHNVDIADCGPFTQGGSVQAACLSANPPQLARQGQVPQGPQARKLTLTAQKQLGNTFVTVGGGVMFAIGPNHGPVLNLNFMLPLPSVGFVIEPSLGYEVGF